MGSKFFKQSLLLFFASFFLMIFYAHWVGQVDFLGDAKEVWDLSSRACYELIPEPRTGAALGNMRITKI
ncbi:hypothetical protein, partial [Acidovorax sp. MR-S7]|uniref:hypothetical protein n=1 Tax=Acidovorax sp. MR-S7 TaxID=1268622 RepID=UPI001F428B35